MKNGQTISYEELRQAAAQAIDEAGISQAQVARDLDVTRGAVSRAIKEPGATFYDLQRRIIEHLTDFRVEKEVRITIRTHEKS